MAPRDSKRWNKRYAEAGDQWQNRKPHQLLLDFAHLLPPSGLALDAASGVAVNGLFLAQRGFHVLALDISEIGLRFALQAARKRGLSLETAVIDLSKPWLPPNKFDVIVNFRFLERATFPVYRQALKTGGLLFFETFVKTKVDVEYPEHYLKPGELSLAFQDYEIVHHETTEVVGSRSKILKATEQLIARR